MNVRITFKNNDTAVHEEFKSMYYSYDKVNNGHSYTVVTEWATKNYPMEIVKSVVVY